MLAATKVAGADRCLDNEVGIVIAGPHRFGPPEPEVFSMVEDLGEERFHHSGVAEGAESGVGDGDEEDGHEKGESKFCPAGHVLCLMHPFDRLSRDVCLYSLLL